MVFWSEGNFAARFQGGVFFFPEMDLAWDVFFVTQRTERLPIFRRRTEEKKNH